MVLVGVGTLAAFVAAGISAASTPSRPVGVISISYRPSPLYDDDSGVVVTFKTGRRAPRGHYYRVEFVIAKHPAPDCTNWAESDDSDLGGRKDQQPVGGTFETVRVKMHSVIWGPWCRGRAEISLWLVSRRQRSRQSPQGPAIPRPRRAVGDALDIGARSSLLFREGVEDLGNVTVTVGATTHLPEIISVRIPVTSQR
jgi:hypothetical protein